MGSFTERRKKRTGSGSWRSRQNAYNAGKRTPLECWQAYVAWWEFLMSIAPPISEAQQARRLADWAEYYERIQKFEAWRKEHGK